MANASISLNYNLFHKYWKNRVEASCLSPIYRRTQNFQILWLYPHYPHKHSHKYISEASTAHAWLEWQEDYSLNGFLTNPIPTSALTNRKIFNTNRVLNQQCFNIAGKSGYNFFFSSIYFNFFNKLYYFINIVL